MFTSVEHPQTNGLTEVANKVILHRLKKKLDDAKGYWADELHFILWSYHTTPHSTTQETLFRLVMGTNAMILVEVLELSSQKILSDEESNEVGLRANLDLLDKCRVSQNQRGEMQSKSHPKLQHQGWSQKLQSRKPSTSQNYKGRGIRQISSQLGGTVLRVRSRWQGSTQTKTLGRPRSFVLMECNKSAPLFELRKM